MNNTLNSTRQLVMTGMMTAVIAVMSQIQFPLPSGVPVTMQTFAIALAAYVLGWKYGLVSTAVYTLLGAVGVPVFAGFSGGLSFTVSPAGGYIWGFFLMVFFCGLGMKFPGKLWLGGLSLLGLTGCHVLGCVQLSIVTGLPLDAAFMAGSAPYLIKDIVSMFAAYVVAGVIRRALHAAGVPVGIDEKRN